MKRLRWGAIGLGLLCLAGAAPAARAADEKTAPALSASDRDAQALAAKIDEYVAARWKEKGVKPAAPADDAEFLRRAYLDLAGKIPPITEVPDFLDNPAKDKRWQLVDRLLRSDLYYGHFAATWRAVIFAQVNSQQAAGLAFNFEGWLRQKMKDNAGWDKLVRELVTAPPGGGSGPGVFYQANENRIENVASATSRLFLGVKLECAQCHNHPFAKWTRAQFWEYAAFFSELPQQGRRPPTGAKPRELTIPGTDKVVGAKFLDGVMPVWKDGVDARVTLADWMTTAENPYFARAAVNRLWEFFFGFGLVEPVDDFKEDNEPSHPELLDELAKQFAAHGFDQQFLIKAITASKAYQLTSTQSDPSQADPRLFARMAVRGMSPEQLYDSLAEATALDPNASVTDPRLGRGGPNSMRAQFLARFPNQDKRSETQTSILQALYFMNGQLTVDATSLQRNKNLNTIATAVNSSTARRIRELYLITLSRRPRPEETERLVKYVESGGPAGDPQKALADVFWALLNSTEFFFNH